MLFQCIGQTFLANRSSDPYVFFGESAEFTVRAELRVSFEKRERIGATVLSAPTLQLWRKTFACQSSLAAIRLPPLARCYTTARSRSKLAVHGESVEATRELRRANVFLSFLGTEA